ncbi:TerB family tellurite resistance protein [Winogradskyella sp.]|jgi:uncharacterized tellurite resistance protein B-like protein|uniref:TerB family tellurite resistance protein n=1 Tax=Winogradskyella sp. TaxID=1883156 RepID=UPI0025DA3231|nr:TerB family tellurite resistance protein [Winogradskyella sp.]MCT4628905.1 TerB family tellurite resistance protein [Winogradskyella sp.]
MSEELLTRLGCLFYAIAKADNNLSFHEYFKLTEILEKHWQHIGETNIAYIKSKFNTLQENNAAAAACFNAFLEFLHQYPNLFDDEFKTLILKTANEIAYAYAKINKSELNFMARLSLEFKK